LFVYAPVGFYKLIDVGMPAFSSEFLFSLWVLEILNFSGQTFFLLDFQVRILHYLNMIKVWSIHSLFFFGQAYINPKFIHIERNYT